MLNKPGLLGVPLTGQVLQSPDHPGGTMLDSLRFTVICELGTQTWVQVVKDVLMSAECSGDNHFPPSLAMLLLIQARMLLAFFAATAHCWLLLINI